MRRPRALACALGLGLLAGCELRLNVASEPPAEDVDPRPRYVALLEEPEFALGRSMASDGMRLVAGAEGDDPGGKVVVYDLPRTRQAPARLHEWSDGFNPRRYAHRSAIALAPPYTFVLDAFFIRVLDAEGKLQAELGMEGDYFDSLAAAEGRVYAGTPEAGIELVREGARDTFGVVHVFSRTGDQWERSVLEPEHGERAFGRQIVARDGWLAVGAPGTSCTDGSSLCGSVTLYRDDGQGGWAFHQQLRGDIADTSFGTAIAFDDAHMVVGGTARRDDEERPYAPGRAYLYERRGELWQLVTELGADEPLRGKGFGGQVALSRRHIAVSTALGSSHPSAYDESSSAGAVYLFDRDSHSLLCAVVPPWPAANWLIQVGDFGTSLWLDDHWLMVGSAIKGNVAAYWLDDILGQSSPDQHAEVDPFRHRQASCLGDLRKALSSPGPQ